MFSIFLFEKCDTPPRFRFPHHAACRLGQRPGASWKTTLVLLGREPAAIVLSQRSLLPARQ